MTISTRKSPVRKAVFPVAGLGTRMLPATKSMPKEMLTIVDRPIIQLAVDEAREAGIEHFIFVTGRNKAVIEDHFDHAVELEDTLQQRMKATELAILEAAMIPAGKATFVRQQRPLGLGHAVACAEGVIGNEPFAVILPDMVMKGKPGCLTQMVEAYAQKGGNLIACEEAPADELHRYGVLALADAAQDIPRITGMVEKPAPGTAPSRQIVSGRYILQPEILPLLRRTKPGAGGEIQLTDAMLALLAQDDFHAVKFTGETYDCGDRLGYILANLAFALSRKALAQDLVPLAQKLLARATVDEQRKAA